MLGVGEGSRVCIEALGVFAFPGIETQLRPSSSAAHLHLIFISSEPRRDLASIYACDSRAAWLSGMCCSQRVMDTPPLANDATIHSTVMCPALGTFESVRELSG